MIPTIAWLVTQKNLRLTVIDSPAHAGSAHSHSERMASPISWVHSSDLDDPTPFLSAGNVLLTDGAQFGFDDAAERYDYDSYVARLVEAEIVGLGFATRFLHQGMPEGLARACEQVGLPLIDVPDRVPFIAVIREVADQIAAERSRRMEWSISAHKAISRAALRPNGLRSILIELERQLSCWVGLFDTTGNPVLVPSQQRSDDRFAPAVRDEVAQALRKGRRSSTNISLASGQVTIQTLGHSGQLRGALALGRGVPLDRAENELVTSVIALSTLALEQNRELEATRAHMRSALLELLLTGNVPAARASAAEMWGKLPEAPLSVVVFPRDVRSHYVLDALELLADENGGQIFFGVRDGLTVVLAEHGVGKQAVVDLVADHNLSAGSAVAADLAELSAAFGRASNALLASRGSVGIADFEEIANTGMLGVLHSAGAEQVALQVLTPLSSFDAEHSTALVETLRAWFTHECSWGATAAQLGVHRHTVRARIDQAAGILQLDLETFEGRLEAWAALRMLE